MLKAFDTGYAACIVQKHANANKGTQMLTIRTIAAIAARYDLEPTDKLVIDSAAQANEYHGTKARLVYWATDDRGVYDAARLLDGYLSEETRSARADAAAYRNFHRNAYGD